MRRLANTLRSFWFELVVVAAAAAAALGVALTENPDRIPETAIWFAAPAAAAAILPLAARRRFPFGAPAAVWLIGAGLSFVDGRLVTGSAVIFVMAMTAAFLLGNLDDAVQARLGLAIVVGGVAIIVYNNPSHETGELFFSPLLFALGWLAGYALHERSAEAKAAEARAWRAEQEREAAARVAVAEERARIARELHDVVAHAVSVMVLQVGAVRHQLPDTLADDREALSRVEQAGRTALTEMRRLLGAMREQNEAAELGPQPGLDALETLSAEIERAGLDVVVHTEGTPTPLPRGLDLSAYRIIQEGLTNVLKHARATRAEVTVRYLPDELAIEVRDDGAARSTNDGLGHGLVGIGERVKIYGGEMSAAPQPQGGFILRARLPLGDDSR